MNADQARAKLRNSPLWSRFGSHSDQPRALEALIGDGWATVEIQSLHHPLHRMVFVYNGLGMRPWSATRRYTAPFDEVVEDILYREQDYATFYCPSSLVSAAAPWLEDEYGDVLTASLVGVVVTQLLNRTLLAVRAAIEAANELNVGVEQRGLELQHWSAGLFEDQVLPPFDWS